MSRKPKNSRAEARAAAEARRKEMKKRREAAKARNAAKASPKTSTASSATPSWKNDKKKDSRVPDHATYWSEYGYYADGKWTSFARPKTHTSTSSGSYSSYWRDRYSGSSWSGGTGYTWKYSGGTDAKQANTMRRVMTEVSRVVNIYDPELKLRYLKEGDLEGTTEKGPDGKMVVTEKAVKKTRKTIFLDPTFVTDDKIDYGKKVDITTGQILLSAPLKRRGVKGESNHASHVLRMHTTKDPHDFAESLMYLALETDAAFRDVEKKTPGFTPYCNTQADHYLKSSGIDKPLKEAFNTIESPREELEDEKDQYQRDLTDGMARATAFSRELQTFSQAPESYGDFDETLEELLAGGRKMRSSSARLEYAKQLVEKLLPPRHSDGSMASMGEGKPQFGPGSGEKELFSKQNFGDISDVDAKKMEGLAKALKSMSDKGQKVKDLKDQVVLEGGVREVKVKHFTSDEYQPKFGRDYDPKSESGRYATYVANLSPIIDMISDAVQFNNDEVRRWEDYSKRSGELDEGGLDKLSYNPERIFYLREEQPKPKVQLGILVDESGSMYGQRAESAKKLAIILTEAFARVKGVDFYVYGHTGDSTGGIDAEIIEYVTPETSLEDAVSLVRMAGRGQNYDSYAIKAVGERLLENATEYKRRILISISDGMPAGSAYGGKESLVHVHSVTKFLRAQGLETFGIGVDGAYNSCSRYFEGYPVIPFDMYGKGNCLDLPNFDPFEVAQKISTFLVEVIRSEN
jgi:hypothetical protein